MGSRRQYTRFDCDSECIQMEIHGDTYDVLLEDLSLGGALVKVSNGVPNSLQVGDMCNLMLCRNPDSCPLKHSCRVVRHDSVSMGVRFLTNRIQ
jgi:c-di-GMP-binding flagellar brake protein YcgR